VDDVELSADGRQLRIRHALDVLGQRVDTVTTADVRVDGDELVVRPSRVEVPGAGPADDAVSALVRDRLAFRVPIDGLPTGIRLERVTVAPTGFELLLTGHDVVLREG
jgi:hypothetical protein